MEPTAVAEEVVATAFARMKSPEAPTSLKCQAGIKASTLQAPTSGLWCHRLRKMPLKISRCSAVDTGALDTAKVASVQAGHGMAWRQGKTQQVVLFSEEPNCKSKPRIFLQHFETGPHSALAQPGPYPSPVAWLQALRSTTELCKGAVYL